jgi:hypothetical protein
MASAGKQFEAVLLQSARRERRAPQEQEAGLVVGLEAEVGVPSPPAFDRALCQRRVHLVRAVLEPYDLADVSRGRERMRQRPRVHEGDRVTALAQFDGRGDPEDTGADDENSFHEGSIDGVAQRRALPRSEAHRGRSATRSAVASGVVEPCRDLGILIPGRGSVAPDAFLLTSLLQLPLADLAQIARLVDPRRRRLMFGIRDADPVALVRVRHR